LLTFFSWLDVFTVTKLYYSSAVEKYIPYRHTELHICARLWIPT